MKYNIEEPELHEIPNVVDIVEDIVADEICSRVLRTVRENGWSTE